jgi:hypothetical protein
MQPLEDDLGSGNMNVLAIVADDDHQYKYNSVVLSDIANILVHQ